MIISGGFSSERFSRGCGLSMYGLTEHLLFKITLVLERECLFLFDLL
jgi:hypothetical protein